MTSAKDCADFSGAAEGRVRESHLDKLPEPDTLCIFMTRGERSVRESAIKVFGKIKRVVIDVDGEQHEYDADSLIRLLEGYEDARDKSRWFKLFGTPERAAQKLTHVCQFTHGGEMCDRCRLYVFNECDGTLRLMSEQRIYDALLEWLRGDA